MLSAVLSRVVVVFVRIKESRYPVLRDINLFCFNIGSLNRTSDELLVIDTHDEFD